MDSKVGGSIMFLIVKIRAKVKQQQYCCYSGTVTLVEAVRMLQNKEISSETLVKKCYERAMEGKLLNIYSHLCSYDDILCQALSSDRRRQRYQEKSILDGVPISIKANIAVFGKPLTASSKILSGENSPYDAHVTTKLLVDAGAILIGLTNMDEFGMGSWGIQSPMYGSIHNPHNNLLSAGGSSSGAAASVAHGSCLLAIGTDTGGSIRLPASWCGVTGFKPTYGLVSRYGVISYASSLDTVGWIAPTPQCCALALPYLVNTSPSINNNNIDNGRTTSITSSCFYSGDSTAVYYNNKSTTTSNGKKEQHQNQQHSSLELKRIKIGIPAAFSVDSCPSYIKSIWNKAAKILVEKGGADIVTIPTTILKPTTIKASLSSYYVLACAEASSNLARYDGLRYGASTHQLVSSSPINDEQYHPGDGTSNINNNNDNPDDLSLVVQQQYGVTRAMGFGPEVIRRILAGTAVLSSNRFHTHYEAAAKQRVILRQEFDEAFNLVDIMLVPTSLSRPPRLADNQQQYNMDDASDCSANMLSSDVMTVPLSLAGLPTMSVPVRLVLPLLEEEEETASESSQQHCKNIKSLGLQVFGPPMSEDLVMKVASFIYDNDH